MSLLDGIETLRKKPLAARRRFVSVFTFITVALIGFIWFAFFIAHLSSFGLARSDSQTLPGAAIQSPYSK